MENVHTVASRKGYPRVVKIWLVIGLVMVLGQIVLGGITRLTGSGLSITKWEIVTGTLPPMNGTAWEAEFDLYKETPQYLKINEGMTLSEFKFIYFWEFFHRLWGRTMGLVFIVPFLLFWYKKWIDPPLMRRLGVVVLLAALTASFGWIMVASGLIDRPWVDAYKLTMHLSVACITYSYLLWVTIGAFQAGTVDKPSRLWKRWAMSLSVVAALQIILGGIMSGAKAALSYPTWPDMNGEMIPKVLLDGAHWSVDNFVNYDKNIFFPALIQFSHRLTAYILTIMILYFTYHWLKAQINPLFRRSVYLLISLLGIQVLLGILTVTNSIGIIPVGWGVLHQAGGILLFSAILFIDYQLFCKRN